MKDRSETLRTGFLKSGLKYAWYDYKDSVPDLRSETYIKLLRSQQLYLPSFIFGEFFKEFGKKIPKMHKIGKIKTIF